MVLGNAGTIGIMILTMDFLSVKDIDPNSE
jgi:hypothetical protein